MKKPAYIKMLGLPEIDDAFAYLNSAEIAFAEFNKQVQWHFSPLGRRASFAKREDALILAIRFEGYLKKCEKVPGSLAWLRMVREGYKEQPCLDQFMEATKGQSKVRLKPVLRDRALRIEELRSYYKTEQARLMAKQIFASHLAIENELRGSRALGQ